MLPQHYKTYLQSSLTRVEFLILEIVVSLLQSQKQGKLEKLARVFPYPITVEGRRRKLQRFLSLPQLSLEKLWFPLIEDWVHRYCQPMQCLTLVIDRTQWGWINLLMVSLVWDSRAIPVTWVLLPKLGNSNLAEQTEILQGVLPLFKRYQVRVLGDREFCSVDLGKWLREQGVGFCLRLKKNLCVETEMQLWQHLDEVGLQPGIQLYFQGVRLRKTRPVSGFDVVCKWKRKTRSQPSKEPWYLLTNLGSLKQATDGYKQRMGIEEMFRDYKKGGYNLEGTGLRGERLMTLILLMTLAYTSAIGQGTYIKKMNQQSYGARQTEKHRIYRRRSTFGVGLDGQQWVKSLEHFWEPMQELIRLSPHKHRFHQRGLRAARLIGSAF